MLIKLAKGITGKNFMEYIKCDDLLSRISTLNPLLVINLYTIEFEN